MKRGGSKKDGRELILTAELPWGRKAVRQGTPEMCKEKKKKKKSLKQGNFGEERVNAFKQAPVLLP